MNIRRTISVLCMLVIVALCFAALGSHRAVQAQDVPAATQAVTASVNGNQVEATLEPTQPAPIPTDTHSSDVNTIVEAVKELALIAALIVLAFKMAGLVPADVMDKALARGFELANGLADNTATPLDNQLIAIAQPILTKLVQDELAKRSTITINPLQSGTVVVPQIQTKDFTGI